MATIYLQDELVTKIDELVEEHNKENAETDRSGFLNFLLDNYTKKK